MPHKKAKTVSCWECQTKGEEGKMANWDSRGWRCNSCYTAELSLLRETRKAEAGMRKAAQDHYYNRFKEGNELTYYSLRFKEWSWPIFWDYVEEVRKEDLLLKQAAQKRTKKEETILPFYGEEISDEEDEDFFSSLPPLEKVNWSEYPED